MFKDLKLYITHNEFAYGEFQQRKETQKKSNGNSKAEKYKDWNGKFTGWT